MSEKAIEQVKENVKAMMAAPSCCAEAKAAGEKWLKALGTADEKKETAALIKELEEDITTIDGLIAFASSADGENVLGKETAASMTKSAKEAKAKGEKYCICPACQALAKILPLKGELLV